MLYDSQPIPIIPYHPLQEYNSQLQMASGAIAGPDDCDQELTGRKSELFRVTINGKGIYSGDIIINTYSYPVLYISSLIYVFSHSLNILNLNQFFSI